jgi:hypothetical protein
MTSDTRSQAPGLKQQTATRRFEVGGGEGLGGGE